MSSGRNLPNPYLYKIRVQDYDDYDGRNANEIAANYGLMNINNIELQPSVSIENGLPSFNTIKRAKKVSINNSRKRTYDSQVSTNPSNDVKNQKSVNTTNNVSNNRNGNTLFFANPDGSGSSVSPFFLHPSAMHAAVPSENASYVMTSHINTPGVNPALFTNGSFVNMQSMQHVLFNNPHLSSNTLNIANGSNTYSQQIQNVNGLIMPNILDLNAKSSCSTSTETTLKTLPNEEHNPNIPLDLSTNSRKSSDNKHKNLNTTNTTVSYYNGQSKTVASSKTTFPYHNSNASLSSSNILTGSYKEPISVSSDRSNLSYISGQMPTSHMQMGMSETKPNFVPDFYNELLFAQSLAKSANIESGTYNEPRASFSGNANMSDIFKQASLAQMYINLQTVNSSSEHCNNETATSNASFAKDTTTEKNSIVNDTSLSEK